MEYSIDQLLQGNSLLNETVFKLAVTQTLGVSISQIQVLAVNYSSPAIARSKTLLLANNFSTVTEVHWNLNFGTGSAPSPSLVRRALLASPSFTLFGQSILKISIVVVKGVTVSILAPSNLLRGNPTDYFYLESELKAPYSVNAVWSVYSAAGDTIPLSTPVLLTEASSRVFIAEEVAQGISFPVAVVLSPPVFLPGETYTLQLSAQDSRSSISDQVYDRVQLTINRPPCCGTLLVSPAEEIGNSSSFTITAFNWTTPSSKLNKGPISFQFFFQTSPSASFLALSSSSPNPSLTVALPAGSKYNIFLVNTTVVVQNSDGAMVTANSATFVFPSNDNSLAYFINLLNGNVSIGTINAVIVTLNEESSGVLLQPVGAACTRSSDCLNENLCISGICQEPSSLPVSTLKICPSSSPVMPCSGHGVCTYYSSVGDSIPICAVNDRACVAYCLCDNGYGGEGCELTSAALRLQDEVRREVCLRLGSLFQTSNVTQADALYSIKEVFQPPDIVTFQTFTVCLSLFEQVLSNLTIQGDNAVAKAVVSIISAVGESLFYANIGNSSKILTSGGSSALESAPKMLLDSYTSILLESMVTGQRINLTASNLEINVVNDYLTTLDNSQFSPGSISRSFINLTNVGLSACSAGATSASLTLTEWTLNPYSNSQSLLTNLLGLSVAHPETPSSLISPFTNVDNSSVFFTTLAFNVPQNLSVSSPREQLANHSFPVECIERVQNAYQPCNCNLSSYSNSSAVFVCNVVETLCPSLERTSASQPPTFSPTLSPTLSSSLQGEFRAGNVFDIREYSALLNSALDEIASVLEYQPSFDSLASQIILGVVLFLVFFLVAGLIFFSRWDAFDRKILLYVPTKHTREWGTKSFSQLAAYRKSLDAAFLAGSMPGILLDDSVCNLLNSFRYAILLCTYRMIWSSIRGAAGYAA